ncbi:hypothetical protein NGM37_21340, partial [Streptomyces sp. TRM76130]|nr:hypothetical protein [Streptomyces sp. TRM76130]
MGGLRSSADRRGRACRSADDGRCGDRVVPDGRTRGGGRGGTARVRRLGHPRQRKWKDCGVLAPSVPRVAGDGQKPVIVI